MNRIYFLIIISILPILSCKAQKFEKVLISQPDTLNLYINDGDSTVLYYLKLVPISKPIGAVVIFTSRGESVQDLLKQIEIPQIAYSNSVITIIPSINWGNESRAKEVEILDFIFNEIVQKHNVPIENFVLGGLSKGGMISLTYAEISKKAKNSTFLIPNDVFGLDVPLDQAHMYEYCVREINRNFSKVGVN